MSYYEALKFLARKYSIEVKERELSNEEKEAQSARESMFIVNGFKYIFSGSDQKQLAQINSSITLAVIGLAGVIISWLVLSFIQNFFFGGNPLFDIDITKFSIPGGSN